MKETIKDSILQEALPGSNEDELLQSQYIGEILCEDLYSYCSNKNVVWKIRNSVEKKKVFHVPAMLLTSGWLAYYGMLKAAIILEIIYWTVINFIPFNLLRIIVCMIWMIYVRMAKYFILRME